MPRTLLSSLTTYGVTTTGVSTSYVNISSTPVLAGLTNWSVAKWVKKLGATPSNGGTLYCERGSSGNDILKVKFKGTAPISSLGLDYRDDAGTLNQFNTTATISDTNWHHIVVTKVGTTVNFYIDGVLSSSPFTLTATDTFTNATIEARLGADKGDNQSFQNASYDDLRLYNVGLTPEEVSKLFRFADVSRGLLRLNKFDEGAGSITVDMMTGAKSPLVSATFTAGIVPAYRLSAP